MKMKKIKKTLTSKKMKTKMNKITLIFFVLISLALVIILLVKQNELSQLRAGDGQEALALEEVMEVVELAEKHILLPEDEVPGLATITDAESLILEQPFYAGSEDGDMLLLYPDNERAFIYSPKRDLIVNVGPLAVDENAETPESTEDIVASESEEDSSSEE